MSSRTIASASSPSGVDDDVGAELLGRLEAAVGEVDGDDVAGAEEAGAHDGGEPDRPGADDGDDVAGLHGAVEDADLVAGGEDVGQHEDLLRRSRRPAPGRSSVSAKGTRTYSAWVPSMVLPRIQPPPPRHWP